MLATPTSATLTGQRMVTESAHVCWYRDQRTFVKWFRSGGWCCQHHLRTRNGVRSTGVVARAERWPQGFAQCRILQICATDSKAEIINCMDLIVWFMVEQCLIRIWTYLNNVETMLSKDQAGRVRVAAAEDKGSSRQSRIGIFAKSRLAARAKQNKRKTWKIQICSLHTYICILAQI